MHRPEPAATAPLTPPDASLAARPGSIGVDCHLLGRRRGGPLVTDPPAGAGAFLEVNVPRSCSVCSHDARAEIDADLVAGRGSLRNVAVRYGTTAPTLLRHKAHLPGTLALAHEAREITRADDLLGILREAVKDARRLRDKAEDEKDYRCAVAAVKVLADIVEKLADVGERLAKSGAEEPRTLAEFMTRIARGERARGGDTPLKVEWVNDWRAPVVAPPGGPAA